MVFKFLAVSVAALLWLVYVAVRLNELKVEPVRSVLDMLSRLSWVNRVAVLLVIAHLTMFAGAKHGTNDVDDVRSTNDVELVEGGTNDWSNVEGGTNGWEIVEGGTNAVDIVEGGDTNEVGGIVLNAQQPMFNGAAFLGGCGPFGTTAPTVVDPDVVRGYRLASVSTNDEISYAMPSEGVVRGTWHLTGAYENVQRVGLESLGGLEGAPFKFPIGNRLCTSLWAYTWGKVRPQLRNISNEIAAVGAPMSAIPGVSRFWTAATTNETYLMTWENFAVGRLPAPRGEDAHPVAGPSDAFGGGYAGTVCAQIELMRNGDFITRSNEVECVYRRVIEPNPIGPGNPEDPDNPGMPVCPYGPAQDFSVIQETNAYCWVDVVVNNADAWVRFEGDGASNLSDPSFAAKAGETNHVVILIGKTYKVTCDMPFAVVAKSDLALDEWWSDDNTLWLNWPVHIEAWEGNGKSFMMHVVPNCLGGEFSWTNSCCSVSGSGIHFSYSCDGHCFCTGCSAKGYYAYEGYCIGCNGGWCGCAYVPGEWNGDDPEPDEGPYAPGISIGFTEHAIIYEAAYEESPGTTVGKHSTVAYLECVVHGGPNGGTATFTFTGRGKLDGEDLPSSVAVPAEHRVRYRIRYLGESPSGNDEDIVVHGDFTENGLEGATCSDEDKLTCVKLELEAQYTAPQNASQNRHTYGVGELVKFKVSPAVSGETLRVVKADSGDSVTDYDTFGGSLEIAPAAENVYRCPATGTRPDVTLLHKGVEYSPSMTVVEPRLVVTREASGSGTFWPGEVGMGILTTRNYIGPFDVSFSGVQIYEVPCTNAIPPTGYFATTNYTGPLTHDYPNAGYLHVPDEQNYWTTDEAGRNMPYSNWSAGTLTWKVPIGWRRIRQGYENQLAALEVDYALYDDKESRPLFIGGSEDAYSQTF